MQLTDVGLKVFLDRYSLKNNRKLAIGSAVIACIDKNTHARELGKVTEITDDFVRVDFGSTNLIYRFPDKNIESDFTTNDFDVPVESVDDVFDRVAKAIHPKILPYLKEGKFIPGGRILAGAGTDYPLSLFNCSVLPAPKDRRSGIFKTASDLAEVLSRGSGVGIPIMSLRPKFSPVMGVGGRSSGSVSWMDLYSQITDKIEQGGCISGDSLIATAEGNFPIKDLVGKTPFVYTYDLSTSCVTIKQVKWVKKTGTKEVYKLTTSKGLVFFATPDHRILLNTGIYRELKDLKYDQQIMTLNREFCNNESVIRNCFDNYDKVLSVVPDHIEDVYDMEVPDTNNFAIVSSKEDPASNGIFIHNSRRGALILVQYIWHPDIIDFITCKKQKNFAIHANLSVAITDSFMKAVEKDENWDLVFPDTTHPDYDKWDGDLEDWLDLGGTLVTHKTVKARSLWNLLVESAWSSGEPGVFFVDRYNQESNSAYYNKIQCTNPCGEIGANSYGVCNLAHLNLSAYTMQHVDEETIRKELSPVVHEAVEFLDNVVDFSQYPLPEQEQVEKGERRIGLGSLGLAEFLMNHEIRYGSKHSLEVADTIYRVVAEEAYKKSIDLAKKKGHFPQYTEKYLERPFVKKVVERLPVEYQKKIKQFGIRNVTLLTQAPTGTVNLILDTSSGIEPYFSMTTQVNTKLGKINTYARPVRKYLKENKLEKIENKPDWMVTTYDLKPIEHVQMQATIQKWVDSSISKTINLPATATTKDVDEAYKELYRLGCKGGTVYRAGSRDDILVSLDKQDKKEVKEAKAWDLRPSPKDGEVSDSKTVSQTTPLGTVHIHFRHHPEDNMITDMFIEGSKSGTEVLSMIEAIGRLISIILRLQSPVSVYKRLLLVIKQLHGIGGSDSVGLGKSKVRSLPDGISKAIWSYLKKIGYKGDLENKDAGFDICPQCHSPSLKMESGCSSCSSCGYSKC